MAVSCTASNLSGENQRLELCSCKDAWNDMFRKQVVFVWNFELPVPKMCSNLDVLRALSWAVSLGGRVAEQRTLIYVDLCQKYGESFFQLTRGNTMGVCLFASVGATPMKHMKIILGTVSTILRAGLCMAHWWLLVKVPQPPSVWKIEVSVCKIVFFQNLLPQHFSSDQTAMGMVSLT